MLRHGLLALALIACLLLAVAEFTYLNQIQILTVTRHGVKTGGHNGYSLLIIGVVGALMAVGAWRGSRPAAFAMAALGLAALLIVLLVDAPDVKATGLYGRDFEQARASASVGFRLETIGAILLLFAGVLTSVVGTWSRSAPARVAPEAAAD